MWHPISHLPLKDIPITSNSPTRPIRIPIPKNPLQHRPLRKHQPAPPLRHLIPPFPLIIGILLDQVRGRARHASGGGRVPEGGQFVLAIDCLGAWGQGLGWLEIELLGGELAGGGLGLGGVGLVGGVGGGWVGVALVLYQQCPPLTGFTDFAAAYLTAAGAAAAAAGSIAHQK